MVMARELSSIVLTISFFCTYRITSNTLRHMKDDHIGASQFQRETQPSHSTARVVKVKGYDDIVVDASLQSRLAACSARAFQLSHSLRTAPALLSSCKGDSMR